MASKERTTKDLDSSILEFKNALKKVNQLEEDLKINSNPDSYSDAAQILRNTKRLIKNRVKQKFKPADNQNQSSDKKSKSQNHSRKRKLSHQRRFYSIRKKSSLRKNPISNPNKEDRKKIISALLRK